MRSDEEGQALVEYALILVLVSTAALTIVSAIGEYPSSRLQQHQRRLLVGTKGLSDPDFQRKPGAAAEVYQSYKPRNPWRKTSGLPGPASDAGSWEPERRHQMERAKPIPIRMYLALTGASRRREGQAMVEYALILALVSVAAVGILSLLGTSVSSIFSSINADL